jgi:small nuclear ribonucleoprotein (snRNP)-like protein
MATCVPADHQKREASNMKLSVYRSALSVFVSVSMLVQGVPSTPLYSQSQDEDNTATLRTTARGLVGRRVNVDTNRSINIKNAKLLAVEDLYLRLEVRVGNQTKKGKVHFRDVAAISETAKAPSDLPRDFIEVQAERLVGVPTNIETTRGIRLNRAIIRTFDSDTKSIEVAVSFGGQMTFGSIKLSDIRSLQRSDVPSRPVASKEKVVASSTAKRSKKSVRRKGIVTPRPRELKSLLESLRFKTVTIVLNNGNTYIGYKVTGVEVATVQDELYGSISVQKVTPRKNRRLQPKKHRAKVTLTAIQEIRDGKKPIDLASGSRSTISERIKGSYVASSPTDKDVSVTLRNGYKFRGTLRNVNLQRKTFNVAVPQKTGSKQFAIPFVVASQLTQGGRTIWFSRNGIPSKSRRGSSSSGGSSSDGGSGKGLLLGIALFVGAIVYAGATAKGGSSSSSDGCWVRELTSCSSCGGDGSQFNPFGSSKCSRCGGSGLHEEEVWKPKSYCK